MESATESIGTPMPLSKSCAKGDSSGPCRGRSTDRRVVAVPDLGLGQPGRVAIARARCEESSGNPRSRPDRTSHVRVVGGMRASSEITS
jgi:hypothetical protein